MRFRVLGQVEVERDGDAVALGGPQQRRLLALLLSERGRVVSIERIVDALWADGESPDAASRSAMKYVSRLRAVVGENVIATVGAGYRLELNGHGCDVEEFEALVDAAGREMPDAAVARYDAALELWRGPAYGEFGDEWWALPEASRLAERRVATEVARAEAQMAMGHHNRAIPDLERMAARTSARRASGAVADAGLAGDGASGRGDAGREWVPPPAGRRDRPGPVRGPGSAGDGDRRR